MKMLVLVFLAASLSAAASISPEILRKSFHQSVLDESKVTEFYNLVSAIEFPSNLEKAYQAAGNAMMAKVTSNPYSKLVYVKKYIELMDEAVLSEGENVEIRFLRIAIDKNVPWIFGREQNVEIDKKVVLDMVAKNAVPSFDPFFKRYILYFLKDEKICNDDEIKLIASSMH